MTIRRQATKYRRLDDHLDNNDGHADNIELLPRTHSSAKSEQTKVDAFDTLLSLSNVELKAAHTGRVPGSKPPHQTQRPPSFQDGWRVGVLISCISAAIVCIINFGITLWVYKDPKYDAIRNGVGTLFKGNCAQARRTNVLIHLLVNVLSTLLLDASSYCMQVLSAPNKEELVRAHANRYWLHIGVPSLRNLTRIGKDRVTIWLLLLLSSVPLHLLFNSVVFLDLQANPYAVIPATEQWLQTGKYDLSGFQDFNEPTTQGILNQIKTFDIDQLRARQFKDVTYENVTSVQDCFNGYNGQYISERGNLYLIHKKAPVLRNPQIWFPAFNTSGRFLWLHINDSKSDVAEKWNPRHPLTNSSLPFISTPDFYPSNGWRCPSRAVQDCDTENENEIPSDKQNWEPYESPIRYCLIEKVKEECHVRFNLPIATAVVVSNLMKTICMAAILLVYRKHAPIITIGDAVATLLEQPDKETEGRCLYDRRLMEALWNWELCHGAGKDELGVEPERFQPKTQKWHMAPSQGRWIASYLIFTVATIAGIIFMSRALQGMPSSPTALWKIGFGEVKGNNLLKFSTSFIGSVFLANTPQVVLSYISLAFEALYTNMFVASEWASYSVERKPLRVTAPVGQQRSTYWLNVPFRYGVPKTIVFGLFHWLTSQSIFTVQITATNLHTRVLDKTPIISTCGYSPMAIILTVSIGTMIAIGGIVIGRFGLPSDMPLASSCSAAISAACHPGAEDVDITLPLRWGVVKQELQNAEGEEIVGHCCFSSLPVEQPIPGKLYA